jgi:hypothetical protein
MKKCYITVILSALFIAGCSAGEYNVVGDYNPAQQSYTGVVAAKDAQRGCPSLPETFQESDLVGTWNVIAGETGSMTLTIKSDGTYKQEYDYPRLRYHYESDWQKWKLDFQDNSTSYVHFQGMQSCSGTCSSSAGGQWYDFCEQKMISVMDNEMTLLLVGVPTATLSLPPDSPRAIPRGIKMYEPVLDPDSNPVVYRLKP